MNETAIWVFTKIATSKDEPAELNTFVFKNKERANKARKLVKELIEGDEENDKIHKDNVNSK